MDGSRNYGAAQTGPGGAQNQTYGTQGGLTGTQGGSTSGNNYGSTNAGPHNSNLAVSDFVAPSLGMC
jgi:hypothetical protein